MMNTRTSHYFFILLFAVTVGVALLLSLANDRRHTVYARGRQEGYAQAQPTPRNIFVGTSCAGPSTSEHIRFGSESSHYYKFLGKGGDWYRISTEIISTDANSVSIDTKLLVYRNNPLDNPGEQPIAENDDKPASEVTGDQPADRYESKLTFLATDDREYWIEVQNLVGDGRGSYCLQIEVTSGDPDQKADICELNNSIDTACEIEIIVVEEFSENDEGTPVTAPAPIPGPADVPGHLYNFHPPVGQGTDLDFYKIWVKAGQHYICQTYDLSSGNDTNMIFFRGDGSDFQPNKGNDDFAPGNRASKVSVTVDYTGWLHVLVNPVVDIDYQFADRYTYRLVCVNELAPDVVQSDATDPDNCEVNDSFDLASACQVILTRQNDGQILGRRGNDQRPLNFAPWSSGVRDIDHFKLWSKAGWGYECRTVNLQNGNDTIMTMYYADDGALTPGNNPNDDYDPNVGLESRVAISAEHTRTGWLIIKVEPAMSFILEDGGDYKYQLECEAHPPAGAALESLNAPGTVADVSGSAEGVSSAPAESGTPLPDTAVSDTAPAAQATPTSPAPDGPTAVSFVALPAAAPTPPVSPGQPVSFTLQIYYDANDNRVKDGGEGIANVPVYLYTGLSESPVQGTTTEGGAIFFDTETDGGRVKLVVPYLDVNQELSVSGVQDVRIRVAP